MNFFDTIIFKIKNRIDNIFPLYFSQALMCTNIEKLQYLAFENKEKV